MRVLRLNAEIWQILSQICTAGRKKLEFAPNPADRGLDSGHPGRDELHQMYDFP